jgi:hypothetical protein
MSTAARNLKMLVDCKNFRPHTWNAEAEAVLRQLASNLIAGSY